MESRRYRAHVLLVPYPSFSHINPLLQFSKRLASKGLKTTLATTIFLSKSMNLKSSSPSPLVQFDTISDGFDDGGSGQCQDLSTYVNTLKEVGSKTLAELIERHKHLEHPIDCVVYDSCMPWALDVAKAYGVFGAAFATQPCTVTFLYCLLHRGVLKFPYSSTTLPLSIPGLSFLGPDDMPLFNFAGRLWLDMLDALKKQFSNSEKADFFLVNTVYGFENEAVDSMSKSCPLLTVGPTIPSFYLDKRIKEDKESGHKPSNDPPSSSEVCIDWLNKKPAGSVVYVSFGSTPLLKPKQMEELALGLKNTNFHFLLVVSASEQAKLPPNFLEDNSNDHNKGLVVSWSPQLDVLSSKAVGCFITHCGWNSTIEALSLGVPMVAMPQWTDQTTTAKLIQDLWKVGVRVHVDEDGIATRDEIEFCIRQVMEGKNGREMKMNAEKWRNVAIEAISQGGTSESNIDLFVSKLTCI